MQRFFQKGSYGLCNIFDDGKKALGQPIKRKKRLPDSVTMHIAALP